MELILLSALLALICLDQRHAFQLALSQPLISCTLIGAFTGNYISAIYFGTIIQLIWLGNLQIGAAKIPEGTIASVVGCLLYVEFSESYSASGQLLLLVVFSYTLLVSFLGAKVNNLILKLNVNIFDYTFVNIRDDKKANIGKVVFVALFIQFLSNLALILVAFLLGDLIISFLQNFSASTFNDIWKYIDLAIIGMGIGMVIGVYKNTRLKQIAVFIGILSLFIFKII